MQQICWRDVARNNRLLVDYRYMRDRLCSVRICSCRLYLRNSTSLLADEAVRQHLKVDASGTCADSADVNCIHVRDSIYKLVNYIFLRERLGTGNPYAFFPGKSSHQHAINAGYS